MRRAAALLLALVGCVTPTTLVSEAPLPVGLVGGKGGLFAYGAFHGGGVVPLLVDTGTVLTSWSGKRRHLARGRFELHDVAIGGAPGVARAAFVDVPLLETRLVAAGEGGRTLDLAQGGVLGGDLLQRFSVGIDYANAVAGSAALTLGPPELSCSCALAAACRAVMPLALAGGGTISIEPDVALYPPTRVLVDACLEPKSDPVLRKQKCIIQDRDGKDVFNAAEYGPAGSGLDVKLLVATGFPGFLLGASAFDRLGATTGAGSPVRAADLPRDVALSFPGRDDPLLAGRWTLGDPARREGRAALVLIERFGLLGPCAELSRSRRLRAAAAERPPDCKERDDPRATCANPATCASDPPPPQRDQVSCLQWLGDLSAARCSDPRGFGRCDDRNQPAASHVELSGPIEILVVPDDAPILQEINFDVRPAVADVEGIIGTSVLSRLRARIDYPNARLIARCQAGAACATWPRFACPETSEVSDCGRDGEKSAALCVAPDRIPVGGGRCESGIP